MSGIVPLGSLNETPYFILKINNMDYKTSFAAIMSYALERNLTSYSVAEVINRMKVEYQTEDLSHAVLLQLISLADVRSSVFGKYAKLIDSAVFTVLLG